MKIPSYTYHIIYSFIQIYHINTIKLSKIYSKYLLVDGKYLKYY